jgi:hypothetical protein
VAELLLGGHPDAALGAEIIPGFGIQQITLTVFTISLADFVRGLAGGALGHDGPPHHNEMSACAWRLLRFTLIAGPTITAKIIPMKTRNPEKVKQFSRLRLFGPSRRLKSGAG